MAQRLLDAGFADSAAFHAYHSYECVLSALIAAQGYAVPPDGWVTFTEPSGKKIRYYPAPNGRIQEGSAHKARILLFNQVADHTKPYFAVHTILSRFLSGSMRNDALYYDATRDLLPQHQYSHGFVYGLLPKLRQFVAEAKGDIR